jgi:MATE family multidrug resistance protein
MQTFPRRGKTSTQCRTCGSIPGRMTFTRATLRELRPTLRLAAPITAGQVGQMLIGVTDTIMVGHVGTLALAACSFANNVLIVIAVTGFGVLTAVSVRVSRAHGGGVAPAMARALHGGLGLSIFGGLAGALCIHIAYPWFHHLGQAPGVVEEARVYMLVVGWSLIPAFATNAARNYLDARSHPWPGFWIIIGGVLLNVFLNWVLIFGHLGAPAMGLAGAGWATFWSRVITAVVMIWFVWAGSYRPTERWRPDLSWWREQAALLRLGVPAGLQLLSEVGAFAVAAILIGRLGAVPLAAHQIAITCASTTFMFPLGVALASTVRIAQASGAGRADLLRPIAAGAWAVGVGCMAFFAVLFLVASQPIAALFVRDPEVISLAASLLLIAGIFQLVDGVQVVGSGLLRGLRDTTAPMIITLAAYWLVALPLGTWLALGAHRGAPGMWIGLAVGLAVAAALLVKRFLDQTR